MKTVLLPFVVCLGLYSFIAVFAQTQPDDSLVLNPLFQKNCAKCHGKTAEGRHFGGPSLKTEKVAGSSSDDLRSIISKGKGRMPGYGDKLTPPEIDRLAAQIEALK